MELLIKNIMYASVNVVFLRVSSSYVVSEYYGTVEETLPRETALYDCQLLDSF